MSSRVARFNRPQTPGFFDEQSTLTSSTSDGGNTAARMTVVSHAKHRSSVVSGWVTIPRSVVMATALDAKHQRSLSRGNLATVADVITFKQRQLAALKEKNKHVTSLGRPKPDVARRPKLRTKKDYFDGLRVEHLMAVKGLAENAANQNQERYKVVPSSEADEDYKEGMSPTFDHVTETRHVVKEKTNIEGAFPNWKHSFVPPSTSLSFYSRDLPRDDVADRENTRPAASRLQRPFTADSSLRSQSDKASRASLYRPRTASSVSSGTARKTKSERRRYKWEESPELRKLLPGYPPRVIRNKNNTDHMPLEGSRRPIMTPDSRWFPVSFNGEIRGEKVKFRCDRYGYLSVASYGDLCHSLSGGMAVLEQPLLVGDKIMLKILATDRRKDLLYFALSPISDVTQQGIPQNRLVCPPNGDSTASSSGWIFSNEIQNIKVEDELTVTFDSLGRIKCAINGEKPIVILQVYDALPRQLAVCLGLGVTQVQLLGSYKDCSDQTKPHNSYEIVPGIRSQPDLPSPFFTYQTPRDQCSFCPKPHSAPLRTPYACDHIKVCRCCQARTECRLCRAPLCWASCPICDTRLSHI